MKLPIKKDSKPALSEDKKADQDPPQPSLREAAFGIWKIQPGFENEDGLACQERLRAEWDGR